MNSTVNTIQLKESFVDGQVVFVVVSSDEADSASQGPFEEVPFTNDQSDDCTSQSNIDHHAITETSTAQVVGLGATTAGQELSPEIFSNSLKISLLKEGRSIDQTSGLKFKAGKTYTIRLSHLKKKCDIVLVMLRKNYPNYPIHFGPTGQDKPPFRIISHSAQRTDVNIGSANNHLGYQISVNGTTDIDIIFDHVSTNRSEAERTSLNIHQTPGKQMELRAMIIDDPIPSSLFFQVTKEVRKSCPKKRSNTSVNDGPTLKVTRKEKEDLIIFHFPKCEESKDSSVFSINKYFQFYLENYNLMTDKEFKDSQSTLCSLLQERRNKKDQEIEDHKSNQLPQY